MLIHMLAMCVTIINEKVAMNLKVNEKKYAGGFGKRKTLYYHIKNK